MADNEFLPKLSQNLLEILDDDEYYDITIEVGNDPNKNDGTLTHVKLPKILPEIFQIILRYIYGGKLSLKEYNDLDIFNILVAANELSLFELIIYLQSFLIKNKTKWMEQNFSLIYQMSFENTFFDLQKFCKKLISKQPEKIFNSPDFTSISEKVLISLIQHDKIKMSEAQVWEYVLKWGIAQHPGLPLDPSSYSNDDFNTLKDTLKQCITFIKFNKFTSIEFLNKVYPYKKIILEEIYEDSIKYFLGNPNNTSEPQVIKEIGSKNIDSRIISIQHVEIISKWIDRLEITDGLKNSYEFELIFRGSRDGLTAEEFHKICDNQSRTITIIKVKDSNEILGGYNPIEWKDNRNIFSKYGTTRDSFIFSFMNKENIEKCLISRVMDETHAIKYWYRYGPSFGDGDLTIYEGHQGRVSFNNKASRCVIASYEKQIRMTRNEFSVEEYEVFRITNDNRLK
ncbi:carbohydrate-binding module family 13 protein [Rhizophagus clarus]|uniref:Carbohydrate-binding module family 13 protein n=1 Tax=Rhizophagus clarus TaxID=94130 RepID=A0A8H3L8D5_9GLOM|nr:carbohydrate-binding module family 13 protein [Rhizophagus clarus]